jgi:EAL domain-containing protein (putative c-di-GMP-specific phosphodiesterase class I)
VWTAQLHGAAEHRRDVATGLRAVLDGGTGEGALRLYRQPVVTVRGGDVRGWEALLRWHRGGEVLPPADFLPVVAGTPLALDLDLWALTATCGGLRRDAAAAGGPDRATGRRVSVNAAPGSLADRRYLDRLLAELDRDPWLGARLGIEVTEEAAAHDEVAAVLAAVRARGVRVLLDDFGTGWSSLTNLVRLPVDSLKVDRLFVERLATREGQAVVGAVVSMAGALGLSVVVEGIETDRQRDQVLALGGTLGQGFLWSEPVGWV